MKNGLGAARGQRFRKGPCASYPTRQFSSLCFRASAQSKMLNRKRRIRTGAREFHHSRVAQRITLPLVSNGCIQLPGLVLSPGTRMMR
jgi:hypothetical protein